MATTEITSKSELASLALELGTKSTELKSVSDTLKSAMKSVSNYDGIDVTSAANTLSSNLDNVSKDLDTVVENIKNYASQVIGFDVDDFNGGTSSSSTKVSYEDIFENDGSKEGVARSVWNFLKYKGLSDAAAAGVLGNIQAECNFNASAIEKSNGVGYGLIQWSYGRRDALEAAAKKAGVDPSNLQFQLEYLWKESLDPNTSYGKNLQSKGFYNTSSPAEAASIFHDVVEKSADDATRIKNNRCAPAESWYNKFKGTDAGDVTGAATSISNSSSAVKDVATSAASAAASAGVTYVSSGSGYSSGSYSGGSSYSGGGSSSGSSSYIEAPSISVPQLSASSPVTISTGDPNIDISRYKNNIEEGFEVTAGNLAYKIGQEDFELLCAIVSAESDKSYDDALAVITTILNRCESPNWIESHGTDPIAQATAPDQFVVYQHGSYKPYMDGKAPDTVIQAVTDALAGVRNHEYLTFRSNSTTDYSDNMITATGNRYK